MSPLESPRIVGRSPALLAAIDLARRIAPTDIPTLIVGETGTGKELLAQLIHAESERSGSLVDVDCGAIPEGLIESVLFGHRRGAFTGAVTESRGLIAESADGTLLLDELSSLPAWAQPKLLRALETGAVRRVGDARSRRVRFRIVATAQHSIGELVRKGRFRGDLVQRVAGIVIRLPSLRDRLGDVPLLAEHFARERGVAMTSDCGEFLSTQDWPGNVRQLQWMITRAAFLCSAGTIDGAALRAAAETGLQPLVAAEPSGLADGISELRALCRECMGDPDEIALAMGIGRSTLYRKLREAGLTLRRFRRPSVAS